MKNGYFVIGVCIFLFAPGAGCGGDDDDDATVLAGMGGAPITAGGLGGSFTPPPGAGAGAVAPPPARGGSGGNGAAGTTPPVAGGSGAGAGASGAGAGGAGSGGTTPPPDAGMMTDGGGMMGAGDCCPDGDCLCHGEPPAALTSMAGPFKVESYDLTSAGCIHYPTDAEPPFAAVAISDGFGGSGGCGFSQTGNWGPLYASWGIVTMIVHTGAGDSPTVRGTKLTAAIAAYKAENMKSGSKLFGKLAGRYGTSGFSMGGGGTTYAATNDPTLKTNVSIMAWTPSTRGIMTPSLYIFGSSDTLAGTMGMASYRSIAEPTPKMAVTVASPHAGQPTAGGGDAGEAGLAFQKVFLEGDTRWRPLLLTVKSSETNIK